MSKQNAPAEKTATKQQIKPQLTVEPLDRMVGFANKSLSLVGKRNPHENLSLNPYFSKVQRQELFSQLASIRGNQALQNSLRHQTYAPKTILQREKETVEDLIKDITSFLKARNTQVEVAFLSSLPLAELRRLKMLTEENRLSEIIRRLNVYAYAKDYKKQVSTLTPDQINQARFEVASQRGITTKKGIPEPGQMRGTRDNLAHLQNFEFLIHVFGAANAYQIDPSLLISLFFQEGGGGFFASKGTRLLPNRSINSFDQYGLDNAFALRGENTKRPELQLGRLTSEKRINENKNVVDSARIRGVRDVLYYTSVEIRKTQARVIEDFAEFKLTAPTGNVLRTWILIYWNGGKSGGKTRLKDSQKRGDVTTILSNTKLVGQRPYLYANRVMGSIDTLERLMVFPH